MPLWIELICFSILALVIFGLLWRQFNQSTVFTDRMLQMQTHMQQTSQTMTQMSHLVQTLRLESAQQAEMGRAQYAQRQAQDLAVLQTQVKDIVAITNQQLDAVRQSMQERLQHLSGSMAQELGQQGQVMLQMRGQLGGLAEAAKNMQAVGQDIASLQDILRAPKLRGNLGELFLEEILRQVLPQDAYQMQYRLAAVDTRAHVTVDAVIRLADHLVPIDSKFPLESFQRLLHSQDDEQVQRRRDFLTVVRKHINDVADTYIRPDAGTYDFALVYLPAENIYYEAVIRNEASDGALNLSEHAAKRKVVLVSPNTLYAYLLTIAYGLRGLRIEKQAKDMHAELSKFQKQFSKFADDFDKVGDHLNRAKSKYDEANKRAQKMTGQVDSMMGLTTQTEQELDSSDAQTRLSSQAS